MFCSSLLKHIDISSTHPYISIQVYKAECTYVYKGIKQLLIVILPVKYSEFIVAHCNDDGIQFINSQTEKTLQLQKLIKIFCSIFAVLGDLKIIYAFCLLIYTYSIKVHVDLFFVIKLSLQQNTCLQYH